MMGIRGFSLNREQRDAVRLELDRAHGNKEYALSLKLRSVLAAGEGRLQKEVATIFKVPLRTLEWWIQQFRSEGISGLVNGPYAGKPSRLSVEQKTELALIIEEGPEAHALDTGVWTAPVVVELVARRFGVRYSCSQVRRILHELGFSVQYPRQKLSQADKERQATWLREELPAIKKKSVRKAAC
jgi:putative transposase